MPIRASVNVSITPELERFVQELVASGRYHSASEVFRDGLRLLEQAERRRLLEKWLSGALTPEEQAKLPAGLLEEARSRIEAKIREGLDALDRGDAVDGDEFFARWKDHLDKGARRRTLSRVKRTR
jgi:putative addiction module CopG family antidote